MEMTEDQRPQDVSVPVGEWFDVPKGLVVAPETYTDRHGVLRSSVNHAIAVWHNGRRGVPPCEFRVMTVDEIEYDPVTGAPWCPVCHAANESRKRIETIFNQGSGNEH